MGWCTLIKNILIKVTNLKVRSTKNNTFAIKKKLKYKIYQ